MAFVSGDVLTRLTEVARRMEDLRPVMDEIGEIGVMAIRRNFEDQGRPKWAGHRPSTIARRGPNALILINKGLRGGLMGSIKHRATSRAVTISAGKKYAALMHFGARKGEFGTVAAVVPAHNVRAHRRGNKRVNAYNVREHTRRIKLPWGNIAARPFMHITEAEDQEIQSVLDDYILGEGENG